MFRFLKDRRGAVAIEFGLIFPMLVLLMLGGVEMTRYALLHQKMDRVSTAMADLVGQAETITTTELNSLYEAVRHLMQPYDFTDEGVVIVTSVGENSGAPRINWQSSGAGSLNATSRIGTAGTPTLPAGMTIDAGETVIAAEVFFDFEPIFSLMGILSPQRLYHRSFFRPRLGTLSTLG